MRKKKIDNNNLLPYFTDNHEDLPQDYLESCKEFFKSLTKEKEYEYKRRLSLRRLGVRENR